MKNPVLALVAVCAVSAGAVVDVRPPTLAQRSSEPPTSSRQAAEQPEVPGRTNSSVIEAAPQGQQPLLDRHAEAAGAP